MAEPPRLLLVYAHPQPHRSRVNRAMLHAVRDLDGVTVHDLYEAAPDGAIDVAGEQALLLQHHTVVLQHPFYWYSTPPLLKEWLDVVLTWGWAYGRGGTALKGKRLVTAITTGGLEASYQKGGFNRFTVRELLAPVDQTAFLCGMEYLPPFVVHGTHRLDDAAIERAAVDYRAVIGALRDGGRPPDGERLNADLGWTLRPAEGPASVAPFRPSTPETARGFGASGPPSSPEPAIEAPNPRAPAEGGRIGAEPASEAGPGKRRSR